MNRPLHVVVLDHSRDGLAPLLAELQQRGYSTVCRTVTRLEELERDYAELTDSLADPAVFGDRQRYTAIAKRQSDLAGVVDTYRTYRQVTDDAGAARELARERVEMSRIRGRVILW